MRFILIFLLFIPIGLMAQQVNNSPIKNNQVQGFKECSTPEPNYEEALKRMRKLQPIIEAERNRRSAAPKLILRLVVHRLSSSTGLEGPTEAAIIAAVDKARSEFDAADICLSLDYINYINHDTVLTVNSTNHLVMTSSFFNPNWGDPDRMDVFVFPQESSGIAGNAGAIPNDYFMIGENRLGLNWETFSHELGHTLGLIHTH